MGAIFVPRSQFKTSLTMRVRVFLCALALLAPDVRKRGCESLQGLYAEDISQCKEHGRIEF